MSSFDFQFRSRLNQLFSPIAGILGFFHPILPVFEKAVRAVFPVAQIVKEIDHFIQPALDQINGDWPGSGLAVVVKAMDQAIDEKHFFGWSPGKWEVYNKTSEQGKDRFRPAELFVLDGSEIYAPGS